MSKWKHKHILDLASFSLEDYSSVMELSHRFRNQPLKGVRKLPALQGRLVSTLFFEPSTRTRSSFELAAKNLSADVQSFTPSTSSISKGESLIDTALTYVAMGADILIVRHNCANVPEQLANELDKTKTNTSILNAGDGLHSHPSQGLLDLYTLANHFKPEQPLPIALSGKRIVIVGDILHSRVARSNLWALTGCGADVILCGPSSLLPSCFSEFVSSPPPGISNDPVVNRGQISIKRDLDEALCDADAVMTLRLQKERMHENLITDLRRYHYEYGLTHERLKSCGKKIPVLHPGPANRGVEISSSLLEDRSICLIEEQVKNGISVRMAILYLVATGKGLTSK